MRKTAGVVLIVLMFLAALTAFTGAARSASPPPFPVMPKPSFPPLTTLLDPVVTIPDSHLRAALHDLTGVPDSDDIRRSHLAALEDPVNLSDKGIADAEGLQYCTHLTWLDLSENPITNLPSLTGLSELDQLRLNGCGLDAFPAGKLPSGLRILDLYNNDMTDLPDSISSLGSLKWLDVSQNDFGKVPDVLLDMDGLEMLNLSACGISKLPSDISGMPNLEELYLNDNGLESLPGEICDMPKLRYLSVSNNSLYSLPGDIGDLELYTLTARNNRIESLPASIGDCDSLYLVDVALNRLIKLPSNFDNHDYDFINVEFNYIDMSSGSADRELIEDTVSMEKYYKRQLKPVTGLTAAPAADSVTLTWQPGGNGSSGGADWEVTGYAVYLFDGSMNHLADLDVDQLSYTHTGLSPETAYQYRVGVNYHVEEPSWNYDVTSRNYTIVDTVTLSAAAAVSPAPATPSASVTTASETPAAEPAEESEPAEEASTSSPQSAGLPAWAIAVIVVGALAIGAGGALLALRLIKKAPAPKAGRNDGQL